MSRRVVSFIVRIERLSKDNNLGGNAESFRPISVLGAMGFFIFYEHREGQNHEYFAALRHIELPGTGHISRGGNKNVRFEICKRESGDR